MLRNLGVKMYTPPGPYPRLMNGNKVSIAQAGLSSPEERLKVAQAQAYTKQSPQGYLGAQRQCAQHRGIV